MLNKIEVFPRQVSSTHPSDTVTYSHKMSRCLAFNKADKPCSNYCQVTHKRDGTVIMHPTCHSHKTYFSTQKMKRDWEWRIETQLYSNFHEGKFTSIRKNILYILLQAVKMGILKLYKHKKPMHMIENVKESFKNDYEKVMKEL
jgi:hypothetical protein